MHPKGRPKKVRIVQKAPRILQFSPRGKPGRPDEAYLAIDQFEAIRLADVNGLDQSQGAQAMGVSRATFGRILREARKLIANALVTGKIIRIHGGSVQISSAVPVSSQSTQLPTNKRSHK
ncbi:MAG TPA: DUF134 domain-containing protein [Candidatus Omnitrophota bacterium]|nr:DUF134 domain-containing protein [Candidatus Omnitrophota bacterium]HPD85208.1 DUF134 domain-containing protein [Candidatus Omnitrophota bacterium]HRZ04291.1 DUF134 domain-containing protein [Candidatus Omnitrophota bacterium]